MIDRPSLKEFKATANNLESIIVRTPLVAYRGEDNDTEVLLKPEILQAVIHFNFAAY